MSFITLPIAIKAIFDHIGGTKISGNASFIKINGAKIIVQGAGGGAGFRKLNAESRLAGRAL